MISDFVNYYIQNIAASNFGKCMNVITQGALPDFVTVSSSD